MINRNKNSVTVSIYLQRDVAAKIAALAKAQDRTFSFIARKLLQQSVEQIEKKEKRNS